MKTVSKFKGVYSNNLSIIKYDHLPENTFVLKDADCQMERIYYIGRDYDLNLYHDTNVKVKSMAQVKRAWETGYIWF